MQLVTSRTLMPLDSLFHHDSKHVSWLHHWSKYILLVYLQSPLVIHCLLLRHNSAIYVDKIFSGNGFDPKPYFKPISQPEENKEMNQLISHHSILHSIHPELSPTCQGWIYRRSQTEKVPACFNHKLWRGQGQENIK